MLKSYSAMSVEKKIIKQDTHQLAFANMVALEISTLFLSSFEG